jgi:superfamily I DNA and/or RNA helicase
MSNIPVVRVASPEARLRVSEPVRPLFLENQAEALVARIEEHLKRLLKEGGIPSPLMQVLGRWRDKVRGDRLELMDRLRRGANIVVVTCGAATQHQVDAVGNFGIYDWVIIEEAAKAWPTELAMPLVRGTRWTLIGDHRQLPAYRRREVEDMLRECANSSDERLRQHAERREDYVRIFDLFAQIFVRSSQAPSSQTPRMLRDPRGELRLQFRMREPIAEVVSQAFYDGNLRTDPSTEADHGLQTPPFVRGQALVWLDTSDLADAHDRPCWHNDGEADVVAWLVSQFKLRQVSADELALLSPYREQIRLMKQRLHSYESCIHTVDSFQGREAKVAVVSLVRNNKEQTPRKQLGHLTSPERVNVLLSRAMRLLVIVGSLEHFERCQHDFWTTVCKTVRERGVVVKASSAGFSAKKRHRS